MKVQYMLLNQVAMENISIVDIVDISSGLSGKKYGKTTTNNQTTKFCSLR